MKKVLIIEDSKDFLWILKQSFSKQEFSVFFAEDGEAGLALAQKEKPDLMIIDIMLPKMDGITVAKKVKESGMTPQIIFLTNLKDPEHISQTMDVADNADYVVKSDVHVDAIVERVKKKLGL